MKNTFISESTQPKPLIKTGIEKVDEILGCIPNGYLTCVGGRPGMGKTTFALRIAENTASSGKKVLMFNPGIETTQLKQILPTMSTNIHVDNLRKNIGGTEPDIEEMVEFTPVEVEDVARRFIAEEGSLDLIIIDYLQLMSMGEYDGYKGGNRGTELAYITRALKEVAVDLNCVVVVLTQLPREVEFRRDHNPVLRDLRCYGNLENDADIVMLLWREEYYQEDQTENEDENSILGHRCEVNIAKHRGGPTGIAEFEWSPKSYKFSEFSEQECMNRYVQKEEKGALNLYNGKGTLLISVKALSDNEVSVSYYNIEIDKGNFAKGWKHSIVSDFGNALNVSIICKDKQEQSLCQTRLMNLIANGFASDFTKMMAMDWTDLERVSSLGDKGMYYHYDVESEDLEDVCKRIEEQLKRENVHWRSAIVCLEGKVRSSLTLEPFFELFGTENSVVQLLWSESDNTLIDIWVFTEEGEN